MRAISVLYILMLILSGCNIRENTLLPPDLVDGEYITGSVINHYANYLVQSRNDNSFLYIPYSSVSDSLFHLGDEILFSKVNSFATRDSISFQEGATELSNTFNLQIKRDQEIVSISAVSSIARIYANVTDASEYYLTGIDSFLHAEKITPEYLSRKRAWFPIHQTGEFALYDFPQDPNPNVTINQNVQTHALLNYDTGQVAFRLPKSYCQAAGAIQLNLSNSLSESQFTAMQASFKSFSVNSRLINVSTQHNTGNLIAYIRTQETHSSRYDTRWTMLNGNNVSVWGSGNSDNPNWSISNSNAYSFILGNGVYFFASYFQEQNSYTIPFDGSFNQIYLEDAWFDLKNIVLDGHSFTWDADADIGSTMLDYFSGSPFVTSGKVKACSFGFTSSGNPIRSLPDGKFIEFGYKSDLPQDNTLRLFTAYRDAREDLVTYKTPGNEYGVDTFVHAGEWIYSSVSNSGFWLCGSITESTGKLEIPYKKPTQFVQTSLIDTYWSQERKADFSKLMIDLSTISSFTHPWLSGEPLSISQTQQIASFHFYKGSSVSESVPDNFTMSLLRQKAYSDVILISDTSPKIRVLQEATTLSHTSYQFANGIFTIAPPYGGVLVNCEYSISNSFDIRVFHQMEFFAPELVLYTSGNGTNTQSSLLHVSRTSAFADPYQLVASQYNLTHTSEVYNLDAESTDFYDLYQPTLYFRRTVRNEIIFFETNQDVYRLYSYHQGTALNPWNFVVDGSYNGIIPAFDGAYGSVSDNAPHSIIPTTVSNSSRDHIVSLYQAQFVLPQFYIGNPVPIGSRVILEKVSSIPQVSSFISAYQISFRTSAGVNYVPNFFQVENSELAPYIYMPVENVSQISNAPLYFRSLSGEIRTMVRVEEFSDNWQNEYIVVGNCLVCSINNSGWIYYTGSSKYKHM